MTGFNTAPFVTPEFGGTVQEGDFDVVCIDGTRHQWVTLLEGYKKRDQISGHTVTSRVVSWRRLPPDEVSRLRHKYYPAFDHIK